jgi:Na+/H+ antiporter NhaD/arsenite permease-like protein
MELQQIVALTVFVGVYALLASRWIHRAAAALVGALILAAGNLGGAVASVVPAVLLVTAGLMVLAGFVKRSGLAAWLALKSAKVARGRPSRILLFAGVLSFALAALVGPAAAVVLVVPVCLVLAVELDVPALPFVLVLAWTALLGGATTQTAQPANLWIASALGLDGWAWIRSVAPFTVTALAVTLLSGVAVFRKVLRVTNERRARVLEYDESQSLQDRPLLIKTLVVLGLVVLGLAAGPWLKLAPEIVVVGGATLLLLWDGPRSVDRSLGEIDGSVLVFFGALCVVVGALGTSGLAAAVAGHFPSSSWGLLWGSAVLSAVVDHGAVAAALVPVLQAWNEAGASQAWVFVVVGSSLGAGATVWGAVSTATALGLAGQGSLKPVRGQFTRYGLLFAALNLVVASALALLLAR